MLMQLADETEDIHTKAKPVVDAIVKVDEIIKTPEVQAVAKGIQSFGESVAKLLLPPPPCYWNYGRARRVKFVYNLPRSRHRYDVMVDEGFIRCLSRRGVSRDEIIKRVSIITGVDARNVAQNFSKFNIY